MSPKNVQSIINQWDLSAFRATETNESSQVRNAKPPQGNSRMTGCSTNVPATI
jgi:hypothetical protein